MIQGTTPNTLALSNPNAIVSHSIGQSSGLRVGTATHLGWSDVHHHWWPDYYPYYPPVRVVPTTTYISSPARINHTEVAFKIVARMMEKDLIAEMPVSKFVKLVNDVADIVKKEGFSS